MGFGLSHLQIFPTLLFSLKEQSECNHNSIAWNISYHEHGQTSAKSLFKNLFVYQKRIPIYLTQINKPTNVFLSYHANKHPCHNFLVLPGRDLFICCTTGEELLAASKIPSCTPCVVNKQLFLLLLCFFKQTPSVTVLNLPRAPLHLWTSAPGPLVNSSNLSSSKSLRLSLSALLLKQVIYSITFPDF